MTVRVTFTAREAADIIGVSTRTVWAMIRDGRLVVGDGGKITAWTLATYLGVTVDELMATVGRADAAE